MTISTQETSFNLILNAGNAKSKGMMAIECAREYDFKRAEVLMEEAKEDLRIAHHSQTALIQGEANGNLPEFSILLVHAQDHLSSTITILDLAEELIHIYRLFKAIKGGETI